MSYTNFKFNEAESIISYDLEDNDVSAQEIADASNGVLKTYIKMKGGIKYYLPNTTLYCVLSREEAKNVFVSALNKSGTNSKITRLFITEVNNQKTYIQDEK